MLKYEKIQTYYTNRNTNFIGNLINDEARRTGNPKTLKTERLRWLIYTKV